MNTYISKSAISSYILAGLLLSCVPVQQVQAEFKVGKKTGIALLLVLLPYMRLLAKESVAKPENNYTYSDLNPLSKNFMPAVDEIVIGQKAKGTSFKLDPSSGKVVPSNKTPATGFLGTVDGYLDLSSKSMVEIAKTYGVPFLLLGLVTGKLKVSVGSTGGFTLQTYKDEAKTTEAKTTDGVK